MKWLVDADFLVAIAKEDDSNHERALGKADQIKDSFIFITPFTIPEAATVLSYRVSQKAAKQFLAEVRKQQFAEIFLDGDLMREADNLFLAKRTKRTSWIDCLNAVAVKRYALDGIASFDAFYRRVGIRML